MFAVYATGTDPVDPLSRLGVGEVDETVAPAGWVTVHVRAASVNHHDLWALRGSAPSEFASPLVLGTDAAGVTDDGREVIVHTVIADPARGGGDETKDPQRSLLSEIHPGTFAGRVHVPVGNLVPKPAELSWEEAACLPTAWLTAYRMLTTHGHAMPGQTVLVQGAGGGVATAVVALGRSMGLTVWVTSRDAATRSWALERGAERAFEPGAALPHDVDLVVETVGAATWQHSVDSVRFGGRIVVAGVTTGAMPPADLLSILAKVVTVQGSVLGTVDELGLLSTMLVNTGIRPVIDRVLPLRDAGTALATMADGAVRGKIVLIPPSVAA